MHPSSSPGAALAVLAVLVAVFASSTAAPPPPDVEDVKQDLCKDICSDINGLNTFYEGRCYCVLEHEPTPKEQPRVVRAVARGAAADLPVATTVVGLDPGQTREQRCLVGLATALRARSGSARAALRSPVVTAMKQFPAAPLSAMSPGVGAVGTLVPVGQVSVAALGSRAAQQGASVSAGAATAPATAPATPPAGTVPVSVLTVAGPLPGPLPPASRGDKQENPESRGSLRERARARANAVSQAASDILRASASGPAPRYSGIVVAPVQTAASMFESPTGVFSSMAGSMFGPYPDAYQQPYQGQQQTVMVNDAAGFPVVSEGGQFLRAASSATQRAADCGADAAHDAVERATDLAARATGAGLGAARSVIGSGRRAASTGLRMADRAIKQAEDAAAAALRAQDEAAIQFLLPPGGVVASRPSGAPASQGGALPRFSFSATSPYYSVGARASEPVAAASSIKTQRSVDAASQVPEVRAAAGIRRASIGMDLSRYAVDSDSARAAPGILTDAAGAVEQAVHSVASGVQHGAASVSHAVQDVYHDVVQGVQQSAATATGAVQGAVQGVQHGVQSGASTVSGLASGALGTAQDLAQSTTHRLQHAAHELAPGVGHPAAEDQDPRARAATRDALQAAASRSIEAVQAVRGAAGAARDLVTSTASEGAAAAQNAQAAALQRVQNVAGQVKGSVAGVAGQLQGQVQDVSGQVRDAVANVAGQVRGTVQGVTGQSAQVVQGVSDAVKGTVMDTAGQVRGQVEGLQQAVKSSVQDAQTAARDAILAAASSGVSRGQQISQGAMDAAQAAVTTAIDKVKQAMGTASSRGTGAALGSALGAARSAMTGLGGLRAAYQGFQDYQRGYPQSQPQFQQGYGGYPTQQGYQGFQSQSGFPQAYPQQGFQSQGGFPQGNSQGFQSQAGFPQSNSQGFQSQAGFPQDNAQSFNQDFPGTSGASGVSWAQQAIDGIAAEANGAGLDAARAGFRAAGTALDAPRRVGVAAAKDGLGLARAAVSALPLGWASRFASLNLTGAAPSGGSATWTVSPTGTSVSVGGVPAASGVIVSKHQRRDARQEPVFKQ